MKIAVIGAGILGLQVAYCTAKRGISVTLFDRKGFPPHNASTIAGGMLAPFSEIETLPASFIDTGLRGISLWREILKNNDAKPNILQETGSLFISHPEDRHMLERFAQHLPKDSNEWTWLDAQHITELEPAINTRFNRGLYLSQEAHVHPLPAMTSLIERIKALDGELCTKEVDPEHLLNAFDRVIDCRGYVAGLDKDLRGIKGEIILLRNPEFSLNRPVRMMHPRYPLYIIPRPGHIFAVGASTIENADDADGHVLLRSAMELMSAAYSLHPGFGEAEILDMSCAVRPAYMDHLPRIKIEENGQTITCNGLFRHGFLLSPVMGESVAHFLATGEENEDFSLFSGTTENKEAKYGTL